MTKNDYEIIRHILAAQQYSDAAKTARAKSAEGWYISRDIYKLKDRHLSEAVAALEGARNSRIAWRIEHKADQNGHPSNVLYFEFNLKGKHYQFSFHNFNKKFRKEKGNNAIVWNGVIGGCRSALHSIRSTKR